MTSPELDYAPMICRSLKVDNESRALNLFFRDYGCESTILSAWVGVFQMLPNLYQRAPRNSATSHAIMAVALAYQERKHRFTGSEVPARTEYSKAIQAINSQLQVQDRAPINEILASICLMSQFELLLPSTTKVKGHPESRLAHMYGAIAMVQRLEAQAKGQVIDTRVLNLIFLQMTINCLNGRLRPPLSLDSWIKRLDFSMPGPTLLCAMYRIAQWQADVDDAVQKTQCFDPETENNIRNLIMLMQMEEAELEVWESSLPPRFQYMMRPVSPYDHAVLQWPGAPHTLHAYPSGLAAVPRTLYFAVRIILNQSLLRCCTWILTWSPKEEEDELLAQCAILKENIAAMISCISRSVNSVLNDFIQPSGADNHGDRMGVEAPGLRGVLMMWQLSVACVATDDPDIMKRIGNERSLWLKIVLGHVQELVGSRGEWERKQ